MIRIGDKDLIVIDRGAERSEDEKRFLVIVDDQNVGFTNPDGSKTEAAKQYIAYALDQEAQGHGAVTIHGSTCVDGGDINTYGDDMGIVYNGGDKVAFMDKELADLLTSNGLATEEV